MLPHHGDRWVTYESGLTGLKSFSAIVFCRLRSDSGRGRADRGREGRRTRNRFDVNDRHLTRFNPHQVAQDAAVFSSDSFRTCVTSHLDGKTLAGKIGRQALDLSPAPFGGGRAQRSPFAQELTRTELRGRIRHSCILVTFSLSLMGSALTALAVVRKLLLRSRVPIVHELPFPASPRGQAPHTSGKVPLR
jgi:hypothetical protein